VLGQAEVILVTDDMDSRWTAATNSASLIAVILLSLAAIVLLIAKWHQRKERARARQKWKDDH
jgi:ABC-type Fe3+ transport system permease subunit